MNRRYFVTVKDMEGIALPRQFEPNVFVFDDKEKMNGFIQEIQKKKPDVRFAVSIVGDDKFEERAG
jgi:hypothetical protein